MLRELRNLDYSPTKESIIYFLCILGDRKYSADIIKVLCSYAPGIFKLSSSHLLLYSMIFGWVNKDDEEYYLSDKILGLINNHDLLNTTMIYDTLSILFAANIMNSDMFTYEADLDRIRFKNELFSLEYSSVRNLLISQGLFEYERLPQRTIFYLSNDYVGVITEKLKEHKRKLTLEQLKKQIEENNDAGEKAEKYVLEFEKKRLPKSMHNQIRRISDIDVAAGYDIVSFDSALSSEIDRFIEVKAINKEKGFYWSKNEFEVAMLKGHHYYLYLVDLSKIEMDDYYPMKINDPAVSIMKSDEWLVESQTYRIRQVSD